MEEKKFANRKFKQSCFKNVLRIIKEKGMKQCVVAERAGYSRSALNNMLNGRKVMKICDVVKLKETLGVDANELYKSE